MWIKQVSRFILVALLIGAVPPDKKSTCPYCENDPKLLAAAGLVSHGPMDFGPEGSVHLANELPAAEWLFLESEHLRWGSSLSTESVKAKDKKRLQAEMDRLREQFPNVPKRVKKLDPYLRIHLMAQRGEDFYKRFQEMLAVTDADFPEERQNEGPYMGNGRFLGGKGKFEVLLHSSRSTHRMFTQKYMGINVTDGVRWHFKGEDKMFASIPAVDSDLRIDRYLHPHIGHNLSHMMLCAYKHFSYDPPIWIDEGLAHCLEQEIDPNFHTVDGEEGSLPDNSGPGDWNKELKTLMKRKKLTSFGGLLHIKSFGVMTREDHISAFAMVRFLLDKHPKQFGEFLGKIKGQLDSAGYPSGQDLLGLQRTALKDIFGWTPTQADAAWRVWLDER